MYFELTHKLLGPLSFQVDPNPYSREVHSQHPPILRNLMESREAEEIYPFWACQSFLCVGKLCWFCKIEMWWAFKEFKHVRKVLLIIEILKILLILSRGAKISSLVFTLLGFLSYVLCCWKLAWFEWKEFCLWSSLWLELRHYLMKVSSCIDLRF